MSGITKILESHTPGQAKPSAKEQAKKLEEAAELVKELVAPDSDLQAAPAQQPKKRGRPPNPKPQTPPSTSPRVPRASPPGLEIPIGEVPRTGKKTYPDPASAIKNKARIRQLRQLKSLFPALCAEELANYNPHMHTPEENEMVIESIKDAVRNEIEMRTLPSITESSILMAEDACMTFAASNPDNPISSHILDFRGTASHILQDPSASMDLALMQCEMIDFLPSNPMIRFAMNAGLVAFRTWRHNRDYRQMAAQQNSGVNAELLSKY